MALDRKEELSRIMLGFIILCKRHKDSLETFVVSSSPNSRRIVERMSCRDFGNKEMGRLSELVGNYAFEANISWPSTHFSPAESAM